MKRYVLTESQLNKVIQNKVKSETITEGSGTNMAMAALMMLTSVTGSFAKKSGKDPKEAVKISQVQQKAAEQLSKRENVSYEEALELIQTAEREYQENYKDKLGSRDITMRGDTPQDLARVLTQLKHGYAIKSTVTDTIIKVVPPKVIEQKVGTTTIEIDGTNMYEEGGFTLTSEAKQHINQELDNVDGLIIGVTVESSTDKQRVSPRLQQTLGDDPHHYGKDNQGLSQDRNDHMVSYLSTVMQCDLVNIDQDVKWEQGKGEMGAETPQDSSARYVKIHVHFVNVGPSEVPNGATEEIIIKTVFELAKPISSKGTPNRPTYNPNFYKPGTCPKPTTKKGKEVRKLDKQYVGSSKVNKGGQKSFKTQRMNKWGGLK